MARFVSDAEAARLRNAGEDSFQKKLYHALRDRTRVNTAHPGFVQPEDTEEWWYLCWERASDACFVWYMEHDESIGRWIRDAARWMTEIPETEWQGPWFRGHGKPMMGYLETAHAALAMSEMLDLAGDLFTEEEKARMEAVLRERGMEPCRRYCEDTVNRTRHIHNWYNVLLTGYGVSAAVLNDPEEIQRVFELLPNACRIFNRDSYGESLQYSNYAALTLSFLQEILLRCFPERAAEIDLSACGRLMDWYAASFLGMKPWDGEDDCRYPRSINFGDSAVMFRPTANLLTQTAARLKDKLPRQAALASWLLKETYAHPEQGSDELATFGFYNHFGYHTVLMEPDRAAAMTPEQAGLGICETYENGQVILRDSWEQTKGVLAVQAGYEPLNTTSHRHQDNGAFQFIHGGERLIVDGGHCCYRLQAQKFSVSASNHATFDFVTPEGETLIQKTPTGNFWAPEKPLIRNIENRQEGKIHILSFDMTEAFDGRVRLARRAVVTALPHAVFIIDQAETEESLRMRTHFPVNNRDGKTLTHRADEHRYVFRRGGQGMKLFECVNEVDGSRTPSRMQFQWGYCHRYYHPKPNQEGQGREGSAEIYDWIDDAPGIRHLRVCAIAADEEPRITGWHIKPDPEGNWYIESPEKEKQLVLQIAEGHVSLMTPEKNILIL